MPEASSRDSPEAAVERKSPELFPRDGIALQIVDLLDAAMTDCPVPLTRLRVDGGGRSQ